MPFRCLVLGLLLAAPGGAALAQAGDTEPATAEQGAAIAPQPAGDDVRNAVAAALVGALGAEFGDAMVDVRLDSAQVVAESDRDQVVSGSGRVRIGASAMADATTGDGDWLAFQYRTRYDTLFASAGWPDVQLGGDGEREVPNDATLVAELEERLATELEQLPGAGRVYLQFDAINSVETGSRFVRIDARGIADFGTGGNTSAHVEAVYDRRDATWLRVRQELGANISVDPMAPVASY
ncbi:hypothetical protein [Luteimonas sp. MC1828]|uniref:hypothetical protein n=1 Tax=Luteimonas sp. MC1828 TaxID=2799787 RepID=UPI0018F1BCE5|nr:hypothetical protein [Luteimonas sp. MC1828]MBJ7574144.1 hypothetical protein [Luteimonas sp. MC1828]